ncbi:MAG: phage Gp37/Gp68 family protein [Sulfuricella sp.]
MENTKISWCDHTVNFWWGCSKVSPACAHCYAEALDARFATAADTKKPFLQARGKHWGIDAPRLLRVDAACLEAFRYQRRAAWRAPGSDAKWSTRFRVFTNSMSDFFEDRRDLDSARLQALDVMRQTPNLDWLILTKRPEKILDLIAIAEAKATAMAFVDLTQESLAIWLNDWRMGKPPANIWLGTTVEDQQRADQRIPALLQVPAAIRFLSCEPLLGQVDLFRVPRPDIDWVICGGESGPHARPMHPDWVRALRDQCAAAGVPFLVKQWGEWAPNCLCGRPVACKETPRPEPGKPGCMFRCGKARACRLLDGVLQDAFPEVQR